MKVYIAVLKEAGSWNISKITGVYSNKKAAEKAIAIPPGYRPSGLCYESIQEFEVKENESEVVEVE